MTPSNQTSRPAALVTGASLGIGRATALSLARAGYDLLITARSADELLSLAGEASEAGAKVETLAADLTVDAERRALLDRAVQFGPRLSAFVHCASAQVDPEAEATIVGTETDRIDETFGATLGSAAHLLRGLSAQLAESAPSRVFFFSSDWALPGAAGPPVFSAAKAGLLHLARMSRTAYSEQGILITVFVLGDVATYDADWENPIWSLDDPVSAVEAAHGNTRIPLQDVVDAVHFVLDRKLARVDELYLMPLRPES